jgi:radical SAM superfamily enzyme YgiQ (UPF0313 family)
MTNKCLLINPPSGLYRREDRCQSKVDDQTVSIIFPPTDLSYMAACIEEAGTECFIRDYPAINSVHGNNPSGWDLYLRDLLEIRPDYLIVSTTTPTIQGDMQSVKLAKEKLPDITTISRGEFFKENDQATLEAFPELDFVIRDESEYVVKSIVLGESPEELNGITYRNGQGIIRKESGPLIEELDKLPFPARHLLDSNLYLSLESGKPITVIMTQRGCPAQCIFCPARAVSGPKIRTRSPENIIRELKECVEKYGIREFLFHGDTFTWDRNWVIELCKQIVDSKLDIRWGANSRPDTVDHERLFWMRNAGCWVVAFGVESGNPEILKSMKKGCKPEAIVNAVKLCKEVGLKTHAFYVIGAPDDSEATLQDTLTLARKLDTDFFDFNIIYPVPGTEYSRIAEEEGLLETNGSKDRYDNEGEAFGYAHAMVRTRHLSGAELNRWRSKMLWNLYLRPNYITRILVNAAHEGYLFNYIKAAIRRSRYLLFP